MKKYTFQGFHFSSSYSMKEISFCILEMISATISFSPLEKQKVAEERLAASIATMKLSLTFEKFFVCFATLSYLNLPMSKLMWEFQNVR